MQQTFNWRTCREMRCATSGGCAVVLNGKVYIGGVGARTEDEEYLVQVYHQSQDEWGFLDRCPVRFFSLTILNSQLVLAGGYDNNGASRVVLAWNTDLRRWTPRYPNMPTARMLPAAIGYRQYLVVAGGTTRELIMDVVEVLNTTSEQWFRATPLPFSTRQPTVSVIGETLFLLGGVSGSKSPSKKVVSISLQDLVSLPTHSRDARTWNVLPDTPLVWSAAASTGNTLIAVGGRDRNGFPQSAVVYYSSVSQSWVDVGDIIPKALSSCACAVLPRGKLFIAGGVGAEKKLSSSAFLQPWTLQLE